MLWICGRALNMKGRTFELLIGLAQLPEINIREAGLNKFWLSKCKVKIRILHECIVHGIGILK